MRSRSEPMKFPAAFTIYRPIYFVHDLKSFCFIEDELNNKFTNIDDFPELGSPNIDMSRAIPIGKSEFDGIIKKFHELTSEKYLALKFYKNSQENNIKYQMMLEHRIKADVMKIQNFARFQGFFYAKDSNEFILCLEYGVANINEILEIRLQDKKPYSCSEIAFILKILLESLRELQKRFKVSHRNIKCENIILVEESPEHWIYKIFNFGSARKLSSNNITSNIDFSLISSHCPLYEAPEVEKGWNLKNPSLKYNPFKADLYSVGIIALKLMGWDDKFILKKKKIGEILNIDSKLQDLNGVLNKILRKTQNKTLFDYDEILDDKEFQQLEKIQPNESEFVKKLRTKEMKIIENSKNQQNNNNCENELRKALHYKATDIHSTSLSKEIETNLSKDQDLQHNDAKINEEPNINKNENNLKKQVSQWEELKSEIEHGYSENINLDLKHLGIILSENFDEIKPEILNEINENRERKDHDINLKNEESWILINRESVCAESEIRKSLELQDKNKTIAESEESKNSRNEEEEEITLRKPSQFDKMDFNYEKHLFEDEEEDEDEEEEEHKSENDKLNVNVINATILQPFATKAAINYNPNDQILKHQLIQNLSNSTLLKDMNLQEIKNEQFEFFEKIGKGGYGFVEKYFDYEKKEFVAFKFIKNDDSDEIAGQIITEKCILEEVNKLHHPSFVKFYGLFLHSQTNRFVFSMEYGLANMSKVLNIMKDNDLKFEYENILYIVKILVNAFLSAQNSNIVNRDIKPSNIILTENKDGDLDWKIIDFGIGCILPEGVTKIPLSTITGLTKSFVAPEINKFLKQPSKTEEIPEYMENELYDPYKADVFSLGKTILDISKRNLSEFPQGLRELLKKMLEEDPKNRFSFKDVMIFLTTKLGNIQKLQPNLTKVVKILKEKEEDLLNADILQSLREQRDEEYIYHKNKEHYEEYAEKYFLCDTFENYEESLKYSSLAFIIYSNIAYNFGKKIYWFSFMLNTYDKMEKLKEQNRSKNSDKNSYPNGIIEKIFLIRKECFLVGNYEKTIEFDQRLCNLQFLIIKSQERSKFYFRIFKNLLKILKLFPELSNPLNEKVREIYDQTICNLEKLDYHFEMSGQIFKLWEIYMKFEDFERFKSSFINFTNRILDHHLSEHSIFYQKYKNFLSKFQHVKDKEARNSLENLYKTTFIQLYEENFLYICTTSKINIEEFIELTFFLNMKKNTLIFFQKYFLKFLKFMRMIIISYCRFSTKFPRYIEIYFIFLYKKNA